MLIYQSQKPNIVTSEYNEELKSVITTWYTMIAPEDTEPCYRAIVKSLQSDESFSIIMNTSEAKNTIRKDDLEWINNFFFPRAIHFGAKDMIVVNPISAITKDALEQYNITAEKAGLFVHIANDLPDALEIAAKIRDDNQID